jgi:serine/threonine protein kinase
MSAALRTCSDVGGFTVDGLLHTGGNGYIYRVAAPADRKTGFPLVMKVPGIGRGEPALGVVSFEVEASILPLLEGHHVPRVVAIGEDPLRPHIVMEEILGENLAALAQRAPLAPDEAASTGAAIADALHDIHRQHVVHHDLKPENCIMRAEGEIVLLDFGFARHAMLPDLLAEEEVFAAGSAPYVSPEQLRGRRGDPRSDVFALGVMLYQLATGELPFGDPATYGGMRDRLWRLPVPPRKIAPAVTAPLQEVILRCLEVDPAKRPPSAAHVAFDLRNPALVQLTSRAEWIRHAGVARQARSWWSARSKSSVSNSAFSSDSLANSRSTWPSMKPSRAARWRSTTKLSDRVRAIIRPAPCARAAALAKARRAASASNR